MINLESEKTHLEFGFSLRDNSDQRIIRAVYAFDLYLSDGEDAPSCLTVGNEVLRAAVETPELSLKMQDVLKTSPGGTLLPLSQAKKLLKEPESADRMVEQKMAEKESRSFLFSRWMIRRLREEKTPEDPQGLWMRALILKLADYGARELFIITTKHTGILSLGMMPISYRIRNPKGEYFGSGLLKLDGSFRLSEMEAELYGKIIDELNPVLCEIVPDLKVSMIVLDRSLNEEGQMVLTAQLVSEKNGKLLPLQYESEGIRKLISVLQLLICVYSQTSVTVAIDELDSGIFEYLLGEILGLLQTHGKGQLIFTSHNLRPLETLNKTSIVFTTTNPENRYSRMKNVKEDNNLRKMYYRDILVQEQDEILYDSANTNTLALAFHRAGKISDEPSEKTEKNSPGLCGGSQ